MDYNINAEYVHFIENDYSIKSNYGENDSPIKIIKYDSGYRNSIALTNHGRVYTWSDFEFGDTTYVTQNKPKLIIFSDNNFIIDACCGYQHTFLLTKFGEVYGFGDNSYGVLGCGFKSKFEVSPIKVLFSDDIKIKSVSCGQLHALALSQSGQLFAWGLNDYGQLGINSLINQLKPITIKLCENNGVIGIRKIVCGTIHSIILTEDGDVYTFGGSLTYHAGKTINVSGIPRIVWRQKFPIKVNSEQKFVDVSAHFNKSIALSATGKFYIWGECGVNLYANPTEIEAKSFADIYQKFASQLEKADSFRIENEKTKQIEATINEKIIKCVCLISNFTALTETGRVFNWDGINDKILDQLEETQISKIVEVKDTRTLELTFSDNQRITDICCGLHHILYLSNDGSVFATGDNLYGQCGQVIIDENIRKTQKFYETKNLKDCDKYLPHHYPAMVTGLESKQIVSMACGDYHSLLLTSNGEVYASGFNLLGQLGVEEKADNSSIFGFFQIFDHMCIKKIACGSNHSLVLSDDGCVYGFGHNYCGQVGSGLKNFSQSIPVTYQSSDTPKFVDIFAYKDFSLALSAHGVCYVWGNCLQRNFSKPTETPFRSMRETQEFYIKIHSKNLNDKIKDTEHYHWFQPGIELGAGNFSTVVKSNHQLDQKDYAVRKRAISYEKIPQIWKEISIWRKLRGDYVTPVHDVWFDENIDHSNLNLVKDLVCKTDLLLNIKTDVCDATLTDLMNFINEEFNLGAFEKLNEIAYCIASQIFVQLLEGVNYLHRQTPPVIHRDLKPDNILIKSNRNSNKFVLINDFGLSCDQNLNTKNVGTPKYKSRDITITTKSDLYSLGIIMSDLFHIVICTLEDYEKDTDSLIDRKYKQSASLCERLFEKKISLRPDCTEALSVKHLWSLTREEIWAENVDPLPDIKNPLLNEIFCNCCSSDFIFEEKLINDLQNINNETINEVMIEVFNYIKIDRCSETNFVKILETVLKLIQKYLNDGNVFALITLSEALHQIVKNSKFKYIANDFLKREVITKLFDILFIYPEQTQIVVNSLLTVLLFNVSKDVEYEFGRAINIVFRIIQNENMDNRMEEMCYYFLFRLTDVKSKRHMIGTEDGMIKLIKQIYRNGLANTNIKIQEFVWSTIWNITDESETVCENFYKSDGLLCFIICYRSFEQNLKLIRLMFGAISNFAECSKLRHHLLDEELVKIFLLQLCSKTYEEMAQCVAGILSYLLLIDVEIWNRTLPHEYLVLVKRFLNGVIPEWNIETKRPINYNSFKPFQQILLSNNSPNEAIYWALWELANLTFVDSEKYCPYLDESDLLNAIEIITNDTYYSTKIRLIALTVMQQYKCYKNK